MSAKPTLRPINPMFSSGPCSKRPGWSTDALESALLGRSHRSAPGKAKLAEVIDLSKAMLGMPEDWRLAIVPASDTGAVEMALWSLVGQRGVDALVWESFGKTWATDLKTQLKLDDLRVLEAPYGEIPDLAAVDWTRDVVFCWNGTTSGVCAPDGDWIAADREGLAICDATSAAFAMDLPWDKLDVATWSWQKAMGGEAAHGMLALSPRAVERLESYTPPWPMPKVFRMTKGGKLIEGLFRGETLNTPSMLCVEDALDALRWIDRIGGREATVARSRESLKLVRDWVAATPWVEFLSKREDTCSSTSICLAFADPDLKALSESELRAFSKSLETRLQGEGVAYDVNNHRDAPPSLRIWGGT
ncbi:MAG TPA: phosphoserine transaminase, partial [Pseudomonadales bacterium]|nr:phosphoserine transaminase [Pseudomonadales bacterium]